MGKNKSKRKSGEKKDEGVVVEKNNSATVTDEEYAQQNPVAPAKRSGTKHEGGTLEENFENLQFEDPFEDEYEEEVLVEQDDEEDGRADTDVAAAVEPAATKIESWTPFHGKLSDDEELEIDESAYTMHHAITPEWPSLSFDFLRDTLGDSRTRFPHSLLCAVGTQADQQDRNKLTVMKLSDLGRTNRKTKGEEEEDMSKPYDEEDEDHDSDDEEQDHKEQDDEDMDPIMEHVSFPHSGGVNRVRAMPQAPHIVATWSDVGNVYLYNVQSALDTFQRSAGQIVKHASNSTSQSKAPFFTYQGHSTEGYAMDWSPVTTGQFATGDCDGSIHVWNPAHNDFATPSNSSWHVTPSAYTSSHSVEDLQWSPTEATVLASADTGGNVCIYDTRRKHKAMLTHRASHTADLNVLAWNHNVTNLLATGADDGALCVWDLRTFGGGSDGGNKVEPLARFTCHTSPITSLEWHPTDESMVLVSDDVGAYVYDLSIEADDEDAEEAGESTIPPQLLFVHAGSKLVKECHWHPQIPSMVMSTALSGFSAFVPSNM